MSLPQLVTTTRTKTTTGTVQTTKFVYIYQQAATDRYLGNHNRTILDSYVILHT